MRSWMSSFVVLGALLALASGCTRNEVSAASPPTPTTASCPRAWRAGWQKLADRIRAPVYCPSWMPNPLDATIGGGSYAGTYVTSKRAYLVSFLVSDPVGSQNNEVHVNFRGYPHQTAIPTCDDTLVANGKVHHPRLPCFSGARGTRRLGGRVVTVYTVNQGVDQWHVLYAWRHAGSLYTVSEHVITPYTYSKVVANLDRMVRGLVLLQPTT